MLEPLCKVFFLCNVKSRSNRPINDTGLGMYSVKYQHMNNQDSSPPQKLYHLLIFMFFQTYVDTNERRYFEECLEPNSCW